MIVGTAVPKIFVGTIVPTNVVGTTVHINSSKISQITKTCQIFLRGGGNE